MKAVKCPICAGKGKVKDKGSTANILKKCRSCEGRGSILLKMLTTPDFPDPMSY